MKKIVITGGSGRFGDVLKKIRTKHKLLFPTKKQLDITNSKKIIYNAKMRNTSICGATETLLVHKRVVRKYINPILNNLEKKGCKIYADQFAQSICYVILYEKKRLPAQIKVNELIKV